MSCKSRVIGDEIGCWLVAAVLYYHTASDERLAVAALIAAAVMARGVAYPSVTALTGVTACVVASRHKIDRPTAPSGD